MSAQEPPASTARLLAALAAAGRGSPEIAARVSGLVRKAQAGAYHDFQSPSPSPTHDLWRDLQQNGLHDLARRAIDGEFDATPEESRAWAESPEGQRLFRELRGEQP